jgi:hypothetical protein
MVYDLVNNTFYTLWRPFLGSLQARFGQVKRIKRISSNYLCYLKVNLGYIEKNLNLNLSSGQNIDVFLRFVAWASLGVHLLLGSVYLQKLRDRKNILEGLIKFSNSASERPDVWAQKDSIKDLKNLLREAGFRWVVDKEDLLELLSSLKTTEIFHLVRFYDLAYVLGILHCKDPTDPPECFISAIKMYRLFNYEQEKYHEIALTVDSQLQFHSWDVTYHHIADELLLLRK